MHCGIFRARALVVACATVLVVQWSNTSSVYRSLGAAQILQTSEVYLSAMTILPDDADGKKLFNCEWEAAPYVLHARPAIRFVDILDPALLWVHDPVKYALRQRLIAGLSPSPATDLRQHFKADYVLCAAEALNAQLKAQPDDFDLLASSDSKPSLAVFHIRRE